jgi:hypothetical protein
MDAVVLIVLIVAGWIVLAAAAAVLIGLLIRNRERGSIQPRDEDH